MIDDAAKKKRGKKEKKEEEEKTNTHTDPFKAAPCWTCRQQQQQQQQQQQRPSLCVGSSQLQMTGGRGRSCQPSGSGAMACDRHHDSLWVMSAHSGGRLGCRLACNRTTAGTTGVCGSRLACFFSLWRLRHIIPRNLLGIFFHGV